MGKAEADNGIIGNSVRFIGLIPQNRLIEILYPEGSYEDFTYWNRRMIIRSINSHGNITDYEFPGTTGSWKGHSIFSCGTDIHHLVNLYNSDETNDIEKEFIRHFIFDYLITRRDTRHGRHHKNLFFYMSFFYTNEGNATNCSMWMHERLFALYFYLQRVGFTFDEIVASVKVKARENAWMESAYSFCKNLNEKESEKVEWWGMPTFPDAKNFEAFSDKMVDYLFNEHLYNQQSICKQAGVYGFANYASVIDKNKVDIKGYGIVEIKPGDIDNIIKKRVVAYQTHSVSYSKCIHPGHSDIPHFHYTDHYIEIKTKRLNPKEIKDGTLVTNCRIEDGIYRDAIKPFKWNAEEFINKYTTGDCLREVIRNIKN